MKTPYYQLTLAVITLSFLFLIGCGGDNDCQISDLSVTTGECNCAENYSLTLNFEVENPNSEFVELFIRNNVSIGFYKISDLPLSIAKFETSPFSYDYLKVCMDEDPDCCAEIEFLAPDCSDECGISNLEVDFGDCTTSGDYELNLNFSFQNAENEFFDLYIRGNELIGTYGLDELPLSLDNFSPSGNEYDFIMACINDAPDCCAEIEFMPPDCVSESCEIFDLVVDVGECNPDGSYVLTLDFEVQNPGNDYFDLFTRNDVFIGFYSIDQLPLTLDQFFPSGNEYDFIRICVNDNPDCCLEIEFLPPECESECAITELFVETGECNDEDAYELWIGFNHSGGTTGTYEVFVRNNVSLGSYDLIENPLMLSDFPVSENEYDFVQVCLDGNLDCCSEIEFMSPECTAAECEISEVDIRVGECTSDSTYNLIIDFEVVNPGNEYFEIFVRNNELLDFYLLDSQRPLEIKDFAKSGEDYDFLKICINDVPDCCYEVEFMTPEC